MTHQTVNLEAVTTEIIGDNIVALQKEVVRRKVAEYRDKFHPEASKFQIDVQMEGHTFWLNIEPLDGPEPPEITEPDQLDEIQDFIENIDLSWIVGMTYISDILANRQEFRIEVDLNVPLETLTLTF